MQSLSDNFAVTVDQSHKADYEEGIKSLIDHMEEENYLVNWEKGRKLPLEEAIAFVLQ